MADLVERQIAALAPLGDVLVCGGGVLPQDGGVARIDARRVIVMEPDPVRQSALARPARGVPAVEVLPVMAGTSYAKAHLNRYNFRPASSVRPPTGIMELFPALHVRDSIEVRVADVADVSKRIRREQGHRNMLIVGTPGEEAAILSHLKVSGRLGVFDHILVPLPETPLYEGSACAPELSDLLRGAGYMLMARDDTDADVQQGHFYRPCEMQAAQASARSEIETLRQRLAKAETALTQVRASVEAEEERLRVRNEAEIGRVRAEATRVAAQCRIIQTMLNARAGS